MKFDYKIISRVKAAIIKYERIMRDKVSIPRVMELHPFIRDIVVAKIQEAETMLGARTGIRIPQSLRTVEYQDGLYALGRTVKNPDGYDAIKRPLGNIVTKAKGGESYHNFGLAFDFCFVYDMDSNGTFEKLSWDTVRDLNDDKVPDWMQVVRIFKEAGFEWGGDWSSIHDAPHLEKRFGHPHNPTDLLAKYHAKDFIPGTQFVNL